MHQRLKKLSRHHPPPTMPPPPPMTFLPQLTMPLNLLTKKKFQPTTHQKLQRRMRLQLPPMMPLLLHMTPQPPTTKHLHTARLHQPTMRHPQRTTPLQLSTELLQVLTRLPNSMEPRCPRPLKLCITVKSLLLKRPLPPGPMSRHSSRF